MDPIQVVSDQKEHDLYVEFSLTSKEWISCDNIPNNQKKAFSAVTKAWNRVAPG